MLQSKFVHTYEYDILTFNTKYQLSLIDLREGNVLYTELVDHCDKLERSSVGARRYCQLS